MKHHAGHDTRHVKAPVNHCFGCGQDNPDGLRLKFFYDEPHRRFVCKFRLSRRFTGPPKHAHGGIIATILDEAMGKVNKIRHVVALTRAMEVHFLKPVPLNQTLTVESHEVRVRGRKHINAAEILNDRREGLASSRATFIAIDPLAMFGKHFEKKGRR
jgi:uncharacterized protein (TIGR00369 family)